MISFILCRSMANSSESVLTIVIDAKRKIFNNRQLATYYLMTFDIISDNGPGRSLKIEDTKDRRCATSLTAQDSDCPDSCSGSSFCFIAPLFSGCSYPGG